MRTGLLYFICVAILSAAAIFAQQTASQMAFTELVSQAEYAVNNAPKDAIPLLKEIITRAGVLQDTQAQESVQMARLHLGSVY